MLRSLQALDGGGDDGGGDGGGGSRIQIGYPDRSLRRRADPGRTMAAVLVAFGALSGAGESGDLHSRARSCGVSALLSR